MAFTGRVYFDFSAETWHFYRFLAAASSQGAELRLSWAPFLADPAMLRPLAAFIAVKDVHADRHGAYLQAALTLVHVDGASPDDDQTYVAASRHAAIDPSAALGWEGSVDAVHTVTADARDIGVCGVPTLFRHGPVMRVVVNPAALQGDVPGRLDLVDRALEDDGVWVLEKP